MLSQRRRRFIDSNIFIYVLLKDPNYWESALKILQRIESGEEAGVTSTLAVSQVLAHLAKRRKEEAARLFVEYLGDVGIEVIETIYADFTDAFKEIGKLHLDFRIWDDLVISCQMKRVGLQEIYTNDDDFRRIPWVVPTFI